jgi:hypothetical protein
MRDAGADGGGAAGGNAGRAVVEPAAMQRQPAAAEGLQPGAEAFLSSFVTVAEEPGSKPDPMVAVAFALGWQMAQMYKPAAWPVNPPKPGADLPGLSKLSGGQRARVGLDQVDVALAQLAPVITAHGLTAPTTTTARDALQGARPTDDVFREALFNLHVSLLSTLTAANFRIGKAYGLGRALSDTTRSPSDLDKLKVELERHRVATLQAWLGDLMSAFPAHAAHTVSKSLEDWRDWAGAPQMNSGEDASHVLRMLRRQGERWRALLSGERQASDLLELQDYVLAGSDMLRRLGSLTWRFLGRFAALLAVAAALFVGGIILILTQSNSAHIAAGIGGVLASFGLTWKSAGSSLGKAAGRLERPLWDASLDDQIATALTLLPGSKRVKNYTPPPV